MSIDVLKLLVQIDVENCLAAKAHFMGLTDKHEKHRERSQAFNAELHELLKASEQGMVSGDSG